MALRYMYASADGVVWTVYAAPKERLELVLGPLSDAEYRKHVFEKSIPKDAKEVKELPEDWVPDEEHLTRRERQGAAFFEKLILEQEARKRK